MPVEVPHELGQEVEHAAARKWGIDLRDERAGWLDGRHRSNGSPVSIKSAMKERQDGRPGVFRFWRHNLRQLQQNGGTVILGVVNPSNPTRKVVGLRKVSLQRIDDMANWQTSNQKRMKGKKEARIPWPEIMSL